MWKCFIIVFGLIPILFGISEAAPVIQGVSGSLTQDSSITINGTNFGSKETAAPIRYDDFEKGTSGKNLLSESSGGWKTNSSTVKYSNTKVRISGSMSAKQDFTSTYNADIGLTSATLGSVNEVYFSGWFTFESGGAPSRNVKILNMGQEGDGGWQTRVDVYPNSNSGHLYAGISSNCTNGSSYAQDWSVSPSSVLKANDGKWHRLEGYLKMGSNGYRDIWVDNVKIASISGQFTSGKCGIEYFHVGYYFSRDTGSPKPWAIRYWDELYVDDTRARVEIGNNSTWANCTHREIQIPTKWSNSSITLTVNLGSYKSGRRAYIYIVDSNGNLNNQGYPITIAGSGGGSPPSDIPNPPTGLRIIE
jgi:hypothetical protein